MCMARIQLLIDDVDRDAFRAQAVREGRSLSDWLREAGRARLADSKAAGLVSADDLRAFFIEIDANLPPGVAEDDWQAHKDRIAQSQTPRVP